VIEVIAADEAVADIHTMMRLRPPASAWHIGNRHTPLQVLKGGGLRIRFDAILVAMVEGLGAHVHAVAAPFAPESGAYARNQATITTIMATMTMNTDELFQLMSWLSPAFPVGAFSYSHGLEYAVEAGLVCDEATLESWVRTCLAQEFAPVSGLLLRAAYGAVAARDSQALSVTLAEARALVPTPEFELECQAQGTAFMTTAAGRLAPGGGAKGHGARPRQAGSPMPARSASPPPPPISRSSPPWPPSFMRW